MYLNNGKLKALMSISSHPCTSILETPVWSRSPSKSSMTSNSVPGSPWNSDSTPTNDDY
jgi:hypothetical protein